MKKKKNSKVFWWILGCFLIIFIGLSIASETGYYESRVANQTHITASAIKQFEKDVKDGKNVQIEDYLEKASVDNSNTMSNLGNKFSKNVEDIINDGIAFMIDVFGKMFG